MTDTLIKSVKPSAAAKQAIAAAQAETDRLLGLVTDTEPSRNGRTSQLHRVADEAEAVFLEAPTRENAERLHDALTRARDAEVSFARIDTVIHQHLPRAAKIAESAALEIIDSALAELDKQHQTAKANVSKNATIFADVAQLDRQHGALVAALEGERAAALGNPLHWLQSKGIA
jgi:hypothetical protein